MNVRNDFQRVRRSITNEARSSTSIALAIFALDGALFLGVGALLVFGSQVFVSALLGLALGLIAGLLFTVGHDACHGSFTSSARLNAVIGRIAFLPTYTPFASWEYAHNAVHHRFTNLRTRDYVWAPFTKEEYDRLPRFRRVVERWYRSTTGLGAYYAVEIWWKRLMRPRGQDLPRHAAAFRRDRWLVCAYAAGEVVAIWRLAAALHTNPLLAVGCGVLLRLIAWNYLMGFVIFQHHTHPLAAWFNDEVEWTYAQAQVGSSVHIVFPRPVNLVLHSIMEHTAHHVDVRIPMYRLPRAQAIAEQAAVEPVLQQPWSIAFYRRCLEACKLYDFERHAWCDFDGRITSLVPRATRSAAAVDATQFAPRLGREQEEAAAVGL